MMFNYYKNSQFFVSNRYLKSSMTFILLFCLHPLEGFAGAHVYNEYWVKNGPIAIIVAKMTWTAESTVDRIPCYGSEYCTLGFVLKEPNGNMRWLHTIYTYHVDKIHINNMSLEQLRKDWLRKKPLPEITGGWDGGVQSGAIPFFSPETCITFMYSTAVPGYWNWKDFPGATCTVNNLSKPKPIACSIKGDFDIAYGNINTSELSDATRTASSTLTCSGDGKVTVYAKPSSGSLVALRSDLSLRASLEVNDKNGTDGVILNVKADTPVGVTVRSTLKANGSITPGPFSGTGTVYIEVN